MQTAFQLDHVVILVNDLAAAIEDYAALGFAVTPGGEHERLQTHNALIAFAEAKRSIGLILTGVPSGFILA